MMISSTSRHPRDGGGLGREGVYSPPVFVAKIYKLIKVKAKVLSILKILSSDLYRRCMRHIVRGIHHVKLTCSLGRRRFQLSKVMLMGFYKVCSGFFHRSNSTAESATVSSHSLIASFVKKGKVTKNSFPTKSRAY